MRLETALAKVTLDRVSRRTPAKVYHPMTLAELQSLMRVFDWNAHIRAQQPPEFQTINVDHPDFYKALDAEISSARSRTFCTYLRWHLLHASAALLPTPFVNEDFAFYGAMLQGAKEQRPRQRCTDYTNQDLGEVVGKAYVAKTFGPEGKARTGDGARHRGGAREGRPRDHLDVGHDEERGARQAEGGRQQDRYPDTWRDYAALRIASGDALGNSQRSNVFEFRRQLAKIGKPVDKTEWLMTPPTVNAYYNPLENNINFPAGILQPPFFNRAADDAVNLGAVGGVVGHELTHGFDDQGRQFDPQGNLRDWWTPADGRPSRNAPPCGKAVRRLHRRRRREAERPADARGERCRQRRPPLRVDGATRHDGEEAASQGRWLHAGAALLCGLGADVVREQDRRACAPARQDQRPLPGPLPHQRRRRQLPRVRESVWPR